MKKRSRHTGESRYPGFGPVFKIKFKAWIPAFAGMTLLLAVPAIADEIVLNDGKILQGTITKEDRRQYTLRMASNMYLRIDKSKVLKVVRTERAISTRPAIRMGDLTPKATAMPAVAPTATPAPSAPVAAQPKTGIESEAVTKDAVTVHKTVVVKTYFVGGSTFSDIERDIFDEEKGKGFLVDHERQAYHTKWRFSWDGATEKDGAQIKWKWAVVRATITTTLPSWAAPQKSGPSAVAAWNAFLHETAALAAGHADICVDFLQTFSEQLSLFRADTEAALRQQTNTQFEALKEKTKKRELGYQRRTKKYFDKSQK